VFDDVTLPHFHSLPLAEFNEEFEILYTIVSVSLSYPFSQWHELYRLVVDIMTKALFADCKVFFYMTVRRRTTGVQRCCGCHRLFLFGFNDFVVYDF
jgi:hypothetical protein